MKIKKKVFTANWNYTWPEFVRRIYSCWLALVRFIIQRSNLDGGTRPPYNLSTGLGDQHIVVAHKTVSDKLSGLLKISSIFYCNHKHEKMLILVQVIELRMSYRVRPPENNFAVVFSGVQGRREGVFRGVVSDSSFAIL